MRVTDLLRTEWGHPAGQSHKVYALTAVLYFALIFVLSISPPSVRFWYQTVSTRYRNLVPLFPEQRGSRGPSVDSTVSSLYSYYIPPVQRVVMAKASTESSKFPTEDSSFAPKASPSQQSIDGFAAGLSFRKMTIYAYTRWTDYQRTVGNCPLIIFGNVVAFPGLLQDNEVDILKRMRWSSAERHDAACSRPSRKRLYDFPESNCWRDIRSVNRQ